MKIRPKYRKYIFIALLLIAILCGYSPIAKRIRIRMYSPAYPAYIQNDPTIEIRLPDLPKIVQRADAYIIAEVVGIRTAEHSYIPEEGTPEYAIYRKLQEYDLEMSFPYNHAEVRIERVLFNRKNSEEIAAGNHIVISKSAEFAEYSPVLEQGMKILVRIGVAEAGAKLPFKYAYSKFGFYYVVNDKYVMPGYQETFGYAYAGERIEKLVNGILSLYRSDPGQPR